MDLPMRRAGHQDIRTVQALRGLACILVIAYHAVGCWGGARMPPRAADAIWPNGAAGVDVFFVISGFVMCVSTTGLSGPAGALRFAVRRAQRVVPLYWLLTGAKLALLAISGAGAVSTWHLTASLLFIPSRDAAGVVRPVLGRGWTLQFEMLFYALFALALALRVPPLRLMLPMLIPLALLGFFRSVQWPASLVLANGLVLEFCLGIGVASACTRLRPRQDLAAGVLALGLLLLLTLPQPGPWRCLAWGLPASMMLAGVVWLEPACGGHLPAWALATGSASYAAYLVHPFLVPLLGKAVLPHVPPVSGAWLLAALSIAISVACGGALHRWVDQPIQGWFAARRRNLGLMLSEAVPQLVQP